MRRAACCALLWLLGAAAALPAWAHPPTAARFQRQRAAAQAAARRQAEPAVAGPDQATCRLTVELSRDDAPQPVAGLLRVWNPASEKALAFRGEIQRELNWCAVEGRTTLTVPQTRLRLEAFHGLTTQVARREIDLAGRAAATVRIPLRTFYDPATRGLRAGNTHLHLMRLTHAEAERYLRLVPQADGLDLVFLSYLERSPEDRHYISNAFTEGDLGRLSQLGALYGNGEEHRHNFGPGGEGFGHVMFLNILKRIEPVSIGPGIMKTGTDGLPLQRGIRTARQDGATVIWCHNKFGHEDIPNWVAGLVDAQNIHDGGTHGSYEDTFYRYLNLGRKVPFSTGTDWFIYDFCRVYTPVEGELTAKKWLDALAQARSYITNGVFLELNAAGQEPGGLIRATPGAALRITGRGIARNPFTRLELIHNGQVIHTADCQPANGHFAAALDYSLRVSESGWVALRIPEKAGQNEFGKDLFAHTSAIEIEVDGRRIFRPDVANALIAEMRHSMAAIQEQGKFANDAEKESVLRVYREGIAALQQEVQSHTQPRQP